jgi:hypothetical protein
MLRNIKQNIHLLKNGEMSETAFKQCLQSYLGLLKHCRGQTIYNEVMRMLVEKNIETKGLDKNAIIKT